MSEFWLISAPGEPTPDRAWSLLQERTTRESDLSKNYKIHLPELKIGTLDTLVGLSDDLTKTDTFIEGVVKKIASYLSDVLEGDSHDKLSENLRANGEDPAHYLANFRWDVAKYPVKLPLKNLSEIISKQVSQIDADLKSRSQQYNQVRTNLQQLERRTTGNLMTRTLGDLVSKEDFVHGSDYLTTLIVVVPKSSAQEWRMTYEKLTDMVVPRSSKLVFEDSDHCLFTVSLFRKVVDEFKLHAREHKFLVRDFAYEENSQDSERNEAQKLEAEKRRQFGPLVRWLKVNFSETFTAWVHIKMLRVFVESVLRYGLPVNFQAVLMEPHRKSHRRLRDTLDALYAHLEASIAGPQENIDIPGIMSNQQEYYPYVYFNIKLDLF
eukprot:scpid10892/ scgid13135/ V-type proton ATPase subunit C; Vacuolar proton pump subunit C